VTEPASQPVPPLRTWRPMILWSAGIVLVLGLAWFVGAVAVQWWQALRTEEMLAKGDYCGMCEAYHEPEPLIAELGGPKHAAARMKLCLRSWVTSTEAKQQALALLGSCGRHGIGPLTEALRAKEPILSATALRQLLRHVNFELVKEAAPAMEELLKDGDESVRKAAATVLQKIRGEETK
jgi:hypothetical protein